MTSSLTNSVPSRVEVQVDPISARVRTLTKLIRARGRAARPGSHSSSYSAYLPAFAATVAVAAASHGSATGWACLYLLGRNTLGLIV